MLARGLRIQIRDGGRGTTVVLPMGPRQIALFRQFHLSPQSARSCPPFRAIIDIIWTQSQHNLSLAAPIDLSRCPSVARLHMFSLERSPGGARQPRQVLPARHCSRLFRACRLPAQRSRLEGARLPTELQVLASVSSSFSARGHTQVFVFSILPATNLPDGSRTRGRLLDRANAPRPCRTCNVSDLLAFICQLNSALEADAAPRASLFDATCCCSLLSSDLVGHPGTSGAPSPRPPRDPQSR